jgi:putative nucleotidyltransferase with HDIG domain
MAAGGILLQAILGAPAVLLFSLAFSLLTGLYLDDSWLLLLLIICGNFIGAISVRRCSRRSAFIYAGLRIAAVNSFLIVTYMLFHPQLSSSELAARFLLAITGGVASGLLAGGLAPFAEYFGSYVTDIKLLELASLDRPLLRELSLQAPGTWNHSMVMGQIAEAAAEAIGANPLLARVGAFYHDIGKIKKPAYFVENQRDCNRHDKLTPSMSALIIKAHVKDGIEMAQEYGLPEVLVDFIPQHHGNSLIEYFYEKALRDAEDDEDVDESHYRYPGPRPQTKEAGILMLADAVEASSRTLSVPVPAKIQGLVQKIINKVFASGELNECNLTLQDLHLIAKSFTRVLTGIYHRRIEYSEPAEKTRDARVARPKPVEPVEENETAVEDGNRLVPEVERFKHAHDTVSADQPDEPLKRLGMH